MKDVWLLVLSLLYIFTVQNSLPREWYHPEWTASSHFIIVVV